MTCSTRVVRQTHAALHQARRGLLDRALPRARHRPGLLRGLDLARVLRARARGDLPPHVAERRAGRAAAEGRAATSREEIDAARTSIVVVRAADDEVRAFHNICRHRGNKLVWQDYPREETSGTCRQFTVQVPRLALQPRGRAAPSCSRSRSSSTSTRPTTASRRCRSTCGRGSSS